MSEHIANSVMVRWMSGLVTGLQNRLQRFESASDLSFLENLCKPSIYRGFSFNYIHIYIQTLLLSNNNSVRNPLTLLLSLCTPKLSCELEGFGGGVVLRLEV